jgi:hypothetical protein
MPITRVHWSVQEDKNGKTWKQTGRGEFTMSIYIYIVRTTFKITYTKMTKTHTHTHKEIKRREYT